MAKEIEIVETLEKIDDTIEDIVEEFKDLGLINSNLANKIISNIKLYKKYVLLAIPVVIAVVIAVQSL